ncbi:acyl-CoA carboxylase epsilon subunit [Streptomyces sp. NPDC026092]|uniref:acyl-CoA carboxylase epsilon subunit n=1 Tax=Streptomyces sp. NPDC026092 TaxID=3154797 RepID=UPI0033FD2133
MPDNQTVPETRTGPLLRVVKGSPSAEELAVLTALLLTRMASPGEDTGPAGPGPTTAGWSRPERRSGFPDPRTWHRP